MNASYYQSMIKQQIEITVAGDAAFAQIVMGTKRSAQKRFDSMEAAMRGSEELVAKYGAAISWTPANGDTNLAMIGTYEIECK